VDGEACEDAQLEGADSVAVLGGEEEGVCAA